MNASPDRPRIAVLGSINMDLVTRAPRLPAPGETILGGPFATSPGGKGANQAVAAARMGAQVAMIGAVGDDSHGQAMLETLRAEGIDVSRVSVRQGTPTGTALITVSAGGENTIVVAPGANATITPADVDAARRAIAEADVLLMQLEVPMDAVAHAAGIAADAGTTVILNAAPAPAGRLAAGLLAATGVLVVNETEAAGITGESGEEALGDGLSRLGVGVAAMTLGARGVWYVHERLGARVDAFPVEAVDTVGAGDAFAGAFAARYAEHQVADALDRMALSDALCWACAAGALATTRAGAIPSLPTRAEVRSLLARSP